MPALLRAEKLMKKVRRAKLAGAAEPRCPLTRAQLARELFELAGFAQSKGWSAEELLRSETKKQERAWRRQERLRAAP